MSRPIEHRPPDHVAVVQMIRVEAVRGAGTDGNPVRKVVQYWTLEGEFAAEYDPCAPTTEWRQR